MTRRGKMVFVTLDDGTGSIDLSVYNEVYEATRHLIREDELLVVNAKISRDDYRDGFRAVAERLLDLTSARHEFAQALRVKLNGNACGDQLKKHIADFRCEPEQSGCSVEIEYETVDAACVMLLPTDWRLRVHDTLLINLRSWLDNSSVEVVYR